MTLLFLSVAERKAMRRLLLFMGLMFTLCLWAITACMAQGVLLTITDPPQSSGFKLLDVRHPEIITGVFTDLRGHSDAGSSLALITYAGVIDFTPLAIGASLGAGLGGPSVGIGASVNLLPEVKAGFLSVLNALYSRPDKFANVKAILSPAAPGLPDLTMSMGPHFSYIFENGFHGKTMVLLFYGASWKF